MEDNKTKSLFVTDQTSFDTFKANRLQSLNAYLVMLQIALSQSDLKAVLANTSRRWYELSGAVTPFLDRIEAITARTTVKSKSMGVTDFQAFYTESKLQTLTLINELTAWVSELTYESFQALCEKTVKRNKAAKPLEVVTVNGVTVNAKEFAALPEFLFAVGAGKSHVDAFYTACNATDTFKYAVFKVVSDALFIKIAQRKRLTADDVRTILETGTENGKPISDARRAKLTEQLPKVLEREAKSAAKASEPASE